MILLIKMQLIFSPHNSYIMNPNVCFLLSQLASQRSNKGSWVKGEKMKNKVTRQKPPGNGAKQECVAVIEAFQTDIMDDQKHANQRD